MKYSLSIIPIKKYIRNKRYELPDPLNSYEDWLRVQNLDLADLSVLELYKEEINVKMALASLDPWEQPRVFINPTEFVEAQTWLLLRIAAIRQEKQRRREIRQW